MTGSTDPPLGFFLCLWGDVLWGVLKRIPQPLLQLPVSLLQLQLQKSQYLQLGPSRGQYYGGSLPNVNQIGSGTVDLPFQVSPLSPSSPMASLRELSLAFNLGRFHSGQARVRV